MGMKMNGYRQLGVLLSKKQDSPLLHGLAIHLFFLFVMNAASASASAV